MHLPRTEIDRFEGRLEYWDAATETAWICDPTTPYHERPSHLLTRLAELVGRVRGSPIESYGSMDLLLRSHRRQGFERGLAQGRAETRARMVRRILRSQGIAVSEGFSADAEAFATAPEGALLTAALGCADEADFLAALRRSSGHGG